MSPQNHPLAVSIILWIQIQHKRSSLTKVPDSYRGFCFVLFEDVSIQMFMEDHIRSDPLQRCRVLQLRKYINIKSGWVESCFPPIRNLQGLVLKTKVTTIWNCINYLTNRKCSIRMESRNDYDSRHHFLSPKLSQSKQNEAGKESLYM